MVMIESLVVALVVLAVGLLVVMRKRATKEVVRRSSGARAGGAPARALPTHPAQTAHAPVHWGVRFTAPRSEPACEQAQALSGKEFPLHKAPSLPLSGCTGVTCRCKLIPLRERRTAERRRTADRRAMVRYEPGKEDRRSGDDRRGNDVWEESR
jgi:hypothetical protein